MAMAAEARVEFAIPVDCSVNTDHPVKRISAQHSLPGHMLQAEEAEASGAASVAAAATAGTDQWVQCDRCGTWRIVPDAAWAAVQADERDVWFCEDAQWDVSTTTPF